MSLSHLSQLSENLVRRLIRVETTVRSFVQLNMILHNSCAVSRYILRIPISRCEPDPSQILACLGILSLVSLKHLITALHWGHVQQLWGAE
jgi:hypothetical protein